MTVDGRMAADQLTLDSPEQTVLILRVRSRVCAVPLEHVTEILVPLPVERVSGAASFVAGVSTIRGAAVPVVDLGLLLGFEGSGHVGRFVTLRVGDRQVAVAVEGVLGVRQLSRSTLQHAPPLVREAAAGSVEALARLDGELLLVLRATHLVPEETCATAAAGGALP